MGFLEASLQTLVREARRCTLNKHLLHSFQPLSREDKAINEQRDHLLQAKSLGRNVIIGMVLCH